MSKSYCGCGPVPKGRKRGTKEECVESNQVRYYGLVKVEPKDLIKSKANIEKIEVKMSVLTIKMRKDYQLWKYEKNEKAKERLKKKCKKQAEEYEDLIKDRKKAIADFAKKSKQLKIDVESSEESESEEDSDEYDE